MVYSVMRHYSQSSYKRKHLIGGLLTVSYVLIMAKSYTSWSTGREPRPDIDVWNLKALPQWHTSSNKTIFPNPSNLFQQFHSLVTKHSSIWTRRGILIQATRLYCGLSRLSHEIESELLEERGDFRSGSGKGQHKSETCCCRFEVSTDQGWSH